MNKNCLLIIDPQNDFCNKDGNLFVPGADMDIKNLVSFIKKNNKILDSIFVSLDTHNMYDIAHPVFWMDKEGKNPAPYTQITLKDFNEGNYKPFFSIFNSWVEEYLTELERKGNFTHTIWPPHCLADSWGWELPKKLKKNLIHFEEKGKKVAFCKKGENVFTENYSVFEAEVPYKEDKATFFNEELANEINSYDKIFIAGEARTHCVLNSIKSLVNKFGDEIINKMILIKDTTSNVPIEPVVNYADDCFVEYGKRGMKFIYSFDKVV